MPSGFADGAAEWIVPLTEMRKTKDQGRNRVSGEIKVKRGLFPK